MTPLYLNGEIVDLESARIPVEDRGFQFGDGVYEGVRVYGGRAFRLRDHLDRLKRSADGVEIALPDLPLEEACLEVIRRSGLEDAFLYIQVTRGAAPRSHAWNSPAPTLLAYARALPRRDRLMEYRTVTTPDIRWGRCDLKTVNLLPNVMARQKAVRAGCQEAVFVRDGVITEASTSNVFVVTEGRIRTHPAGSRILSGISRGIILGLAANVVQEACPLEDALRADEVFLTGTTTEVTAVVEMDGRPIGDGKAGPVTRRLAASYEALWREECSG